MGNRYVSTMERMVCVVPNSERVCAAKELSFTRYFKMMRIAKQAVIVATRSGRFRFALGMALAVIKTMMLLNKMNTIPNGELENTKKRLRSNSQIQRERIGHT